MNGDTGLAAASPVDVLDTGAAAGLLIRGAAGRTIGYSAGLVIGLLAVPLMIRELGVERYGFFITASSVALLIYAVTEAGLTALGVREYSTASESERPRVLRNLLGIRLFLTVAGVAVASTILAVTGAQTAIVWGTLILGLGLLLLGGAAVVSGRAAGPAATRLGDGAGALAAVDGHRSDAGRRRCARQPERVLLGERSRFGGGSGSDGRAPPVARSRYGLPSIERPGSSCCARHCRSRSARPSRSCTSASASC